MTESPVLRLLTFTPGDDGLTDAALRRVLVRLRESGSTTAWAGRRHEQIRERVIVSIWPSAAAMDGAVGGNELALAGSGLPDPADVALAVLPLAVSLAFAGDEAQILRVFRGRVKAGELDAYVTEVRSGTVQDDAAGRGPIALHLGVSAPDAFITVSAWSGWEPVEAATGGDVRHPVWTRHQERLVESGVDHYEMLPAAPDQG